MSHSHDHDHSHDCCGHDHGHAKKEAAQCCGHEHSHDHSHGKCCTPDHADAGCCGHEHQHDHSCSHAHQHTHDGCCGHDHSHDHDHGDDSDAAWTHRTFMFIEMVVLLMIGGVLCYFVASGRIEGRGGASYVTGWFKGLALAGGLGIIIMGLFNFFQRRQNGGCGHAHDEGECCDHEHSHDGETAHAPHTHDGSMGGRALLLLLLSGSIAAGAMLTPDGYSAKFMLTKGAAMDAGANGAAPKQTAAELAVKKEAAASGGLTLAMVEKYQPRNKDGNFELGVMQLYYTGSDPEYAKIMDGQPVETTGQMVKDDVNPGVGHVRLFTLQVTCCAADARPYSIPVVFEGKTPEYSEMGWYKVAGTLTFTQERGIKVALIKAKDITASLRPSGQRTIF